MANDDQHPADQLAQSFHDLIDGEGFKQTIRAAWDRITGKSPDAQPQESDTVKAMNKAAMDKAVQDANKGFADRANQQSLTPQSAAKIRTKAMGK